jgi:simple sugar transport system ATP-binding protein
MNAEMLDKKYPLNAQEIVVSMQGISKQFPGVLANDNVDFSLQKGEIHALLGENGAGKSTLMNILTGLYKPDSGVVIVNGIKETFSSPRQAIAAGIGMVHQHFMLVPTQSVTENVLLGLNDPRFRLNLSKYDQRIKELGEQMGLPIDPTSKIWQLSVGEQQRVELIKMLYRGANVLILDEPTAVLAPQEIESFFETLRKMTNLGKSIVFISHKLNEVLLIADRVTVMRRGKVTAAGVNPKGMTIRDLAKLMVGREVIFDLDKKKVTPGEIVLSVTNLRCENDKGLPALRGVDLNVRHGEIVGLAGVAGNGQRELAEVITGLRTCSTGSVKLHDTDVTNKAPRSSIQLGISHVPEDRHHVGTAPNLSLTDNVIMKTYNQNPIGRGWTLNQLAADSYANELRTAYEILSPTIKTPVRLLSGGNLQRVILAREISSKPALMVAMQPTRGLDVGAIEGVQRLLLLQREAGAGVLLVSEELDELLALSDRIYVIYEGRIMGEVTDKDVDKIGMMMTGTTLEKVLEMKGGDHD